MWRCCWPPALGPGTIVGSASFNLLFITGVCLTAPCPRVSRVHQFKVFLITSFFAVEAYLWLLIIIEFNTPERIDLWEVGLCLLSPLPCVRSIRTAAIPLLLWFPLSRF